MKGEAAVSLQAASLLNRFVTLSPVQAYPLYSVSKLSSSSGTGGKKNGH